MAAREQEIRRLSLMIGEHEGKLSTLQVVNHIESSEIRGLQEQLEKRDRQMRELQGELEETRRRLD
jgi:hypothetical protein